MTEIHFEEGHGEEPDNVEEISQPIVEPDIDQVQNDMLEIRTLLRQKDLEFTKRFEINLWTDSPAFENIVNAVYEAIKADLGRAVSRNMVVYQKALKVALLNLYEVYRSHPAKFVRYSRDESQYVAKSRYNKHEISDVLLKIIDCLVNYGFVVDSEKGFYDRETGKGKESRMRAGHRLIQLFQEAHGEEPDSDRFEIKRHFEEIVLKAPKKDGKAKFKEYKETTSIKRMRGTIRGINKRLESLDIALYLDDDERDTLRYILHEKAALKRAKRLKISPDKIKLPHDWREPDDRPFFNTRNDAVYRVFSDGEFDKGGRFYGHWVQGIPSRDYKFRNRLVINGEPVVELDYSCLHLHMLYQLEKLPIPAGDLYKLDGIDSSKRTLVKMIMNAMLNADSFFKAIKAIFSKLPEVLDKPERTEDEATNKRLQEEHRQLKRDKYKEIKAIGILLLEKHKHIEKHVNTGVGIDLQYKDSRIAEAVMIQLGKQNVPCIPVHDSFIVQKKYETELKEAMENCYRKIMKTEPPRIDRK